MALNVVPASIGSQCTASSNDAPMDFQDEPSSESPDSFNYEQFFIGCIYSPFNSNSLTLIIGIWWSFINFCRDIQLIFHELECSCDLTMLFLVWFEFTNVCSSLSVELKIFKCNGEVTFAFTVAILN